MEQIYTSGLRNNALKESGNSTNMRGTWRVGGKINARSSSLTELQVKIDCDLERKQEKTVRS